jgi:hypothetical protein
VFIDRAAYYESLAPLLALGLITVLLTLAAWAWLITALVHLVKCWARQYPEAADVPGDRFYVLIILALVSLLVAGLFSAGALVFVLR